MRSGPASVTGALQVPPTWWRAAWRRVGAGLALLLVWAVGACGGGAVATVEDLQEVPEPRLERVEPAVRQQLEQRRAAVDAAVAGKAEMAELARAYGELGAAYHLYDLREPAAVAYRNAWLLDPREPRWAYYLGLLDRDLGDLDEAAKSLDQVLELSPDYLPARIQRAEIDLLANRPEDAAKGFRKALAQAPESTAALYGLGRAELAQGDAAAAARSLEKALELEPAADAMRYPLALAYRKLGRAEDAAAAMAARGSTGPSLDDPWWASVTAEATGAGLHLKRGGLAAVAGDAAAAVAAYREAVAANPDSAAAHQSLGSALARQGDWANARSELEAALALDPDNAVVHSNLGQVLLSLDQPEAAREHLEKAVELDPRRFEARIALGQLAQSQNRPSDAEAQYRAALDLDGDLDEARFYLASLLGRRGAYAEAAELFAQVRRRQPGQVSAWLGEATARSLAGDREAARTTLEEGLAAQPEGSAESLELADTLARLLATGGGDGERAVSLAEAAFSGLGTVERGETLAMAYAAAGRFDDALEWQERLLAEARRAGDTAAQRRLEANLERYRRGERATLDGGGAAGAAR